jgi:hypothetical protein
MPPMSIQQPDEIPMLNHNLMFLYNEGQPLPVGFPPARTILNGTGKMCAREERAFLEKCAAVFYDLNLAEDGDSL